MVGFHYSYSLRQAVRPRLSGLMAAARRLLMCWHARHVQRLELAEIDEHLLRDLRLTPEDVRRECSKSFWQP
jgi:uncharacterized protein YjiS (DUF1127 family)